MILIVSDDSKSDFGMILEEAISAVGTQVVRLSANTLSVKPCTACGSCGGKTYGRCIIPDDMQQLLPKIVSCRTLILVSPVIFGGVSYHIKKVMDRMAAIGDPRYYINGGEIVKGMNIKDFEYCMVGFGNDLSEAEQSAFMYLHEENRIIMNVKGRAFIFDGKTNKLSLDKIAQGIIHE